LRRLSRLHSAARARDAVAEARAAGFDNLSLDLMMWLPEQRTSDWLETVDGAIALGPIICRSICWRCNPNAPLKENGSRALVAGARRGRRVDVHHGNGAARGGGTAAV